MPVESLIIHVTGQVPNYEVLANYSAEAFFFLYPGLTAFFSFSPQTFLNASAAPIRIESNITL